MLIAVDRGSVLLEKRPPTGIWGGLWSLPEIDLSEDPAAVCRSRFGIKVRKLPAWANLLHGFTHFRLRITPQPLQVIDLTPRVEHPGRLWLPVADALGAALPQPVRLLLTRLDAIA